MLPLQSKQIPLFTMTIFINNEKYETFEGARVIDAINLYLNSNKLLKDHVVTEVTDQYGNRLNDNGRLAPNTEIIIDSELA
ncbi:MAG TPA: hypothetical protein VK212_00725 [Lentimicrobium sp.]|nr:hypothetical protein [Lentimicrobium sp.]